MKEPTLKTLGDVKHVLREAQQKLLRDSKYLGGVVDMIEEAIDNKHKRKSENNDNGSWP
jgi:hypothetical protein